MTVRRDKTALLGLDQLGANPVTLLFRGAGFADEIIYDVAFAGVFLALDLRHQPVIVRRCERHALASHAGNP